MGYKNLIFKRLILCVSPLIFVQIYMTHPLFDTGNYNDTPPPPVSGPPREGGGAKGTTCPGPQPKGGGDLRDETKFPIVYCDMTSRFCQNLPAFTAIVPVHSSQYIIEAFTEKKTWHGKLSSCSYASANALS